MGRRIRECYLCGESYKYCSTCSQDRAKPAWMSLFHSESCKNIFDICTRFNMGMISKTEAQEELNACDLSNKEKFKSYVQYDLEVIFAEDPIVVVSDSEIHEDKTATETVARGSDKKKSHEVVIEKENK